MFKQLLSVLAALLAIGLMEGRALAGFSGSSDLNAGILATYDGKTDVNLNSQLGSVNLPLETLSGPGTSRRTLTGSASSSAGSNSAGSGATLSYSLTGIDPAPTTDTVSMAAYSSISVNIQPTMDIHAQDRFYAETDFGVSGSLAAGDSIRITLDANLYSASRSTYIYLFRSDPYPLTFSTPGAFSYSIDTGKLFIGDQNVLATQYGGFAINVQIAIILHRGAGGGQSNVIIDPGVGVTAVPASVPAPASASLLLSGLVVVGGIAHRRRRLV